MADCAGEAAKVEHLTIIVVIVIIVLIVVIIIVINMLTSSSLSTSSLPSFMVVKISTLVMKLMVGVIVAHSLTPMDSVFDSQSQ